MTGLFLYFKERVGIEGGAELCIHGKLLSFENLHWLPRNRQVGKFFFPLIHFMSGNPLERGSAEKDTSKPFLVKIKMKYLLDRLFKKITEK